MQNQYFWRIIHNKVREKYLPRVNAWILFDCLVCMVEMYTIEDHGVSRSICSLRKIYYFSLVLAVREWYISLVSFEGLRGIGFLKIFIYYEF